MWRSMPLDSSTCTSPAQTIPPSISHLSNLQTIVYHGLAAFNLDSCRDTRKLTNSCGDMHQSHHKKYSKSQETRILIPLLVNLHRLDTLKISINYGFSTSDPKIRKLTLSGCRIVGAMPNLQVLKLRNRACEGQFCQLMVLEVEDTNLEQWRANEAHFPRLQRLKLKRLHKLEEIPYDLGEIPTLEMIELVDCLPSAVASAEQIQEEQHNMGNEYLKIHTEATFGIGMNW